MMRVVKFLTIFAVIVVGWFLTAPYIGAYLVVEKPLARADAIIVLSGSAVYKERTQHAAEIYRQGIAPLVIITNDGGRSGWSQTEQANLPYVELEQRELVANGVPPDAIVTLTDVVHGTDDEGRAVAAEIERRSMTSLLIVTSPHHTRRALRTFEKIAPEDVEIGIVHTANTLDPTYWWLNPSGWRTVAGEYVKSIVYWGYY